MVVQLHSVNRTSVKRSRTLCAHIQIRWLFSFQTTSYEPTKFRDRLRSDSAMLCEKRYSCRMYHAVGAMITHWEKKPFSLLLARMLVLLMNKNPIAHDIFTCIFAFILRRTLGEDTTICFPTYQRQKISNIHLTSNRVAIIITSDIIW